MPRCASHYPISQFIYRIVQASGLKRSKFIQSLGFRNIQGGLRSLDRWLDTGDGDPLLIERLIRVYSLDPAAINAALLETGRQRQAESEWAQREREQLERRNFRQYLFVETPPGALRSSFTVAAIAAPALKTISLPDDLSAKPALDQLQFIADLIRRHFDDHGGKLPLFVEILGYRFVNTTTRASGSTPPEISSNASAGTSQNRRAQSKLVGRRSRRDC